MTGGGAECMRELRLWFPWLREDLTDVRLWLICFNYAGGGTWIFGRWQQAFPREIQVLPAMLPGRESRFSEKPYESLESLSSVLAKLVAELTRDTPYAIFGHSFGGYLGYELIRLLVKEGYKPPVCFFASGCRAPHLTRFCSEMHHLPDPEFKEAVEKRFGALPKVIARDPVLLPIYLRSIRADLAILERYAYTAGKPLPCPIFALGASDDLEVPVPDLIAWVEHTREKFIAELFSGGHFFIRLRQDEVLRVLSRRLSLWVETW